MRKKEMSANADLECDAVAYLRSLTNLIRYILPCLLSIYLLYVGNAIMLRFGIYDHFHSKDRLNRDDDVKTIL